MESVAEYIVFLPIGTPISTVNRIVIAGITYEVIGHDSGRTDASQIAVDVKKIA